MSDPKSSDATLRTKDPEELGDKPTNDMAKLRPAPHPLSEIDGLPAESAPELRDIIVDGKIDHPDGKR